MAKLTRRGMLRLLLAATTTGLVPVNALAQSKTEEVIEITGTIKWFDVEKGYGFIAADGGGEAVLLHITCLRAGGYQSAAEGARIRCQVLKRPRGWQAFRVLSLMSAAPQRVYQQARVKWFNRERGFGFIDRGDARSEVFVHMETLRRFAT